MLLYYLDLNRFTILHIDLFQFNFLMFSVKERGCLYMYEYLNEQDKKSMKIIIFWGNKILFLNSLADLFYKTSKV